MPPDSSPPIARARELVRELRTMIASATAAPAPPTPAAQQPQRGGPLAPLTTPT